MTFFISNMRLNKCFLSERLLAEEACVGIGTVDVCRRRRFVQDTSADLCRKAAPAEEGGQDEKGHVEKGQPLCTTTSTTFSLIYEQKSWSRLKVDVNFAFLCH